MDREQYILKYAYSVGEATKDTAIGGVAGAVARNL